MRESIRVCVCVCENMHVCTRVQTKTIKFNMMTILVRGIYLVLRKQMRNIVSGTASQKEENMSQSY